MTVARAVTAVTLRRSPRLRPWADQILSDACLGAAEAMANHRPDGGAALSSRMWRRATGAVLDGLRDRSPLSRSEWQAGIQLEDLPAHRQSPASAQALEEMCGGAWHPAQPGGDPADRVATHDQLERLLETCTPRERSVLVALYIHGYTGTAVAAMLGVTLARVSQIHHRTLAQLRAEATTPGAS